MKPFEEKYTAWIDGKLSAEELAAFEQELPHVEDARGDQRSVQLLGELLRQHGTAPAMPNAAFFSHELLRQIALEAEEARAAENIAGRASEGRSFWSFGNLAWAAACVVLLTITGVFTFAPHLLTRGDTTGLAMQRGKVSLPITAATVAIDPLAAVQKEPTYEASVIEATAAEPGISASVYSQAENVTVIWLDGLDYLPASYSLQ